MNDVTNLFEDFNLFSVSFAELDGIDDFCHFYNGRLIARGILHKLMKPGLLKPQPDAEHNIGVGDCCDILRSGLVGVGVCACR